MSNELKLFFSSDYYWIQAQAQAVIAAAAAASTTIKKDFLFREEYFYIDIV